MRVIRPPFQELMNGVSGIVVCYCGSHLHTREATYDHWKMGHFDTYTTLNRYVVSVDSFEQTVSAATAEDALTIAYSNASDEGKIVIQSKDRLRVIALEE